MCMHMNMHMCACYPTPSCAYISQELMYNRNLSADMLRKIHAAVEPPPPSAYPEATGLLPAGTQVILGCLQSQAGLNGERGVLLGTDSASGRYQVKLAGGKSVKVKPENVLPQGPDQVEESTPNEGSDMEEDNEDGYDEDDYDEDGYSSYEGEDGYDM